MRPLSTDQIRDFVMACHGDFEKVKQLLSAFPQLVNAAHPWSEEDTETLIQAAAQVGNSAIAEYLLEKGAPLEICTAAMLGRESDLEKLLQEEPERINAKGAHGIPLLTHAAMSGNLHLVKLLYKRGARTGDSHALHNAVSRGYVDIARWLLENAKPDLNWRNFQGKTALAVAVDSGRKELVDLFGKYDSAKD